MFKIPSGAKINEPKKFALPTDLAHRGTVENKKSIRFNLREFFDSFYKTADRTKNHHGILLESEKRREG